MTSSCRSRCIRTKHSVLHKAVDSQIAVHALTYQTNVTSRALRVVLGNAGIPNAVQLMSRCSDAPVPQNRGSVCGITRLTQRRNSVDKTRSIAHTYASKTVHESGTSRVEGHRVEEHRAASMLQLKAQPEIQPTDPAAKVPTGNTAPKQARRSCGHTPATKVAPLHKPRSWS